MALGFVTASARILEGYAAARQTCIRVGRCAGYCSAVPKQRVETPAVEVTDDRPLIAATAVVAIEAAALAASAIGLTLYQLLGHRPHDPLDAWLVVGLAALGAVVLAVVGRGLLRRRRWARSPAVLTQLLTIPVGISTIANGVWWAGLPLLVCGALGLAALFAPSTTRALVGH